MRKFAKYILIGGAVLLLVYILATLGLNIYLQSEGLQERIRATAESALGSPVRIQGTHYTPWAGFGINGISIRGQALPGQAPLLEAVAVSFRFSLIALLQGKLVVSEVSIVNPSLSSPFVYEQAASHPEEPVVVPAQTAIPPVEMPEQPPATLELTPPTPTPLAPSAPPAVEVKRIRVQNGTAHFFDSKGLLALTLTGVDISSEILPDRSVTGTFRIAESGVGAFVHPRNVKGTFSWKAGHLVIPDLVADWAGGKLTGVIEVEKGKEFSVLAGADGVLIKQLAADAGINGEGSRGRLLANGVLRGSAGKPETFEGNVEIALQGARFQPLDIIRQIGELMSIQELQMLELKTAEARLKIRDRKVHAETVVLESENLVLDAKGPVGFDGKMKLQARLLLNERLRKDLSGLLGNNFKESERPGYEQMPFSITGTISRPKTDLLDKLTGFRIGQDLGGLLKNLFKAPPEKKKDPSPAEKNPGGG
ncbi:MAG: AsmA-like C-terminal region-containing protein [Terrimicrobiaceae bacterium]